MSARNLISMLGGAAVLLSANVWSQPLGVPPGRWWERPKVAEAVALTPEQRQRLEAITLDHARVMIDLKATVEKAELEVRAAADREPFDAAKVRAAFGGLQQARQRLEAERFDMLLQCREVLSADQWAKLKELIREQRERRMQGEQPGGPLRQRHFHD